MARKLRRDTLRIAEEAAEWLDALAEGGTQKRADFAAWLRASPRHVEEFLIMRTLDDEAERLDVQRKFNVERLLAQVGKNVVAMHGERRSAGAAFTRNRPVRWAAGFAALGLALAVAWWAGPLVSGTQTFATAIGEQRAIELEDGSIVHLNALSRVAVHLSKRTRDVQLLEGEALFKVAHEAARPFRVYADRAVIRAVGTQFNVYRRPGGTSVSVIEGRVEVKPAPHDATRQLSAGEGAQIATDGEFTGTTVDAAEATAWRQRRLIFRDSTLADIAAEFNRYNRSPQITVKGASLRARRYGGTFDADDPESLIDFLRPDPHLAVERAGPDLIVRPRIN